MVLALAAALLACTPTDDTGPAGDTDADTDPGIDPDADTTDWRQGLVRVVHNVWDHETLDIRVNDAAIDLVEAFPIGGSTGYIDWFDAGTWSFALTDADGNDVVAVTDVTVSPGAAYTVLGFGLHSYGAAVAGFLEDDLSSVPDGQVRVRVVHTATGLPALDLYVGGDLKWNDLAHGGVGAYVDLEAGAQVWGIDLTQDGTSELECTLDADTTAFTATPPVYLVTIVPSETQYVAYLLVYSDAQEPAVALCGFAG